MPSKGIQQKPAGVDKSPVAKKNGFKKNEIN